MNCHGIYSALKSAQSMVLMFGLAVATPAQGDTSAPAENPGATAPGSIKIELNRTDQMDGACRLTFTAQNGLGTDVSGMVLETVLFDATGGVITLSLFDFQSLPKDKPRVRQFDLAGTQCAGLGQILINGVARCDGADPATCQGALQLGSRTKQEVLG